MVADVLSRITTHLGPEAMQSILDGVNLGAAQRAKDDPAMVKGDYEIEEEVLVSTGQVLVEMHVTNWLQPKEKTRTRCSIALVRGQKED